MRAYCLTLCAHTHTVKVGGVVRFDWLATIRLAVAQLKAYARFNEEANAAAITSIDEYAKIMEEAAATVVMKAQGETLPIAAVAHGVV